MKIKLDELKLKDSKHFHFEGIIEELPDLEFQLVKPIKVSYSVDFFAEEVLVKGEFSTKIKIACVKCLEDYEKEIKGQIESVYLDSKVLKEYANSFEEEAESDENFYEEIIDGTIDVSELVREHLILEIDPYGVCSDKCEGLEEMKNYEDDGIDPRWAQILEMSKNK